jgi:hypothetical protein
MYYVIAVVLYRERERANMHHQGIARNRPFYMGLALAEGQKLECFK